MPRARFAEFSCEVYPPWAKVTWLVEDVEIEESEKYRMREVGAERFLEMLNVKRGDDGKVSASTVDVECYATLTVEGRFDSGPYSIHIQFKKGKKTIIHIKGVYATIITIPVHVH